MSSIYQLRPLVVVLISFLILSACSGDDADSAAATTTAPVEDTTTTTEAPDEANDLQAPLPSIDDRTPEEVSIDQIDLMALQLGIPAENLEAAVNCVIERFDSEGVALTGEGLQPLLALNGCAPEVVTEWLPETNPALAQQDWDCTVRSIGEWVNDGTIAEGEEFLTAETPPQEFLDRTAQSCGIDGDTITAALSS